MLNFVSEKDNISISDIQSKMLNLAGDQKGKLLESFSSNKEAFDSLGLDSSIWNKPIPNTKSKQPFKRGEGRYRVKQIEPIEYTDLDVADSLGDINAEYDISDLSPETLANLTDEEIIEWVANNEELNQAMDLRAQTRKDLGMEAAPEIEATNVNNETPKINNNFRGNKNNRTPQEQFIDKLIGKQNPGQQTSRVFNYGGKEYAIYDNLEVNSKDLSKGFTGGRVVDLETNKLINAREAFPEINKALMDGDLDTAFEKISSFEESKYTFSKSELNEKIVNKHTDNANTQNQNQQESRTEQQARTEQQHKKQEDNFEETRTEQKQQTKENHKENKKLNTENADTSKTKTTKTVDVDGPETGPIIKTKKQKLERMKGKKLSPGSTKVKSNLKVGKNVKGKDLRQILINTTVSKALNTVEETVEKAVETGTKTAINYQKANMIHPDQMDDFQIGDLTDDEFEHAKQLANGNQEKIDEWTERRNKARANKVLEHYTDQTSGGYYSNSEFKNPYEYEVPNMEFEVDADGKTTINKTGGTRKVEIESNKSSKRLAIESANKSSNSLDDVLSWMKEHKLGVLDIGMNVYGTISSYKESRREGRGVVSSAVRAGVNFAVYEMLGFWGSLGVGLAKNLPSLAIKGTTLLYKENRKMNSAANNQLFGGAQFHDTQQLATMRQSGMEMAKMAQYNLQQTLMGNEATHFHR